MPHNNTRTTREAREAATSELRDRVKALRELAERCDDAAADTKRWALERAAQLAQVADWMAEAYGSCDDCGEALEHFVSANVGGVLCPRCDGEIISEMATAEPLPGLENRHPRHGNDCDNCHGAAGAHASARQWLCNACFYLERCAVCRHPRWTHFATRELAGALLQTIAPAAVVEPSGPCACCDTLKTFHAVDPHAVDAIGAILSGLRERAS